MIIHLLSSPRNISTALMYSLAQRTDMTVMDEPFYGYYLSRFDVKHPDAQHIIRDMTCDFEEIVHQINSRHTRNTHVFIKNMAHHLIDTPLDFLHTHRTILFIRDPRAIITSFAKVIPNPTLQDIGVKHQVFLFNELNHLCNIPPIVLEAADLLRNPEKMLEKLCLEIGIPYQSNMLHWQKGGIPEDGIWAKHWYKNVHNSTGFLPPKEVDEVFPVHCQALLDEAKPFYLTLKQHALTY
jgi:hypothetical protein